MSSQVSGQKGVTQFLGASEEGWGRGKVLGISSPCTTWRQGRRIEMGSGQSTSTICSIDPMVTDIYKRTGRQALAPLLSTL